MTNLHQYLINKTFLITNLNRIKKIIPFSNSNIIYYNQNNRYLNLDNNINKKRKRFHFENQLNNNLVLIPLGGLGEIGMNCMLIGIDHHFIMIDCGLMFTDLSNFGIKKVLPDINIINYFKNNIEGVIITHGHEDHIGALQWVLPILRQNAILMVSSFVFNIVSKRLEKINSQTVSKIRIFQLKQKFVLGSFSCQTFRVTHSIPDCCGIVIYTKYGNIIHTGDWKIDEYPLDGESLDRSFLEKLGKDNTLLLMSDSTNSLSNGRTVSEKIVQNSLIDIISDSKIKGRIITTQFASNVYRLYAIKKAANLTDKKICFLGASLNSYLEASLNDGRAPFHPNELMKENDLNHIDPNKVIIVTTGSQGENRSTLNLASVDLSNKLNLNANDTLIYSAKIIPGNDKKVIRMLNRISNHGCEIIYGNNKGLHTSGHAYKDELKEILRIIKPKYFLPVHGETISLSTHSKLALNECGIQNTILLRNGQILVFPSTNEAAINPLILGELNIRNNFQIHYDTVGSYQDIQLTDKFKIGNDGIIIIHIEYLRNGKNLTDECFSSTIRITTRGVMTGRGKIMQLIRKIIINILRKCRSELSIYSTELIITDTVTYSCFKLFKYFPEIITIINEFNN